MYKNTLKRYLDDLASKKPAPGGGSAAALVAATGVSLISMVANFTVGKEKYKQFAEEIKQALVLSGSLRTKLLKLVDEDVLAYQKLSHAYQLPKDNPEGRRKRDAAMQQGLKEALGPPLEICRCAHEAIKLCPLLRERGNTNLLSDVEVAVLLLKAAFQSALLNVEINLKNIQDEHFILEIREILEQLEKGVLKWSEK